MLTQLHARALTRVRCSAWQLCHLTFIHRHKRLGNGSATCISNMYVAVSCSCWPTPPGCTILHQCQSRSLAGRVGPSQDLISTDGGMSKQCAQGTSVVTACAPTTSCILCHLSLTMYICCMCAVCARVHVRVYPCYCLQAAVPKAQPCSADVH